MIGTQLVGTKGERCRDAPQVDLVIRKGSDHQVEFRSYLDVHVAHFVHTCPLQAPLLQNSLQSLCRRQKAVYGCWNVAPLRCLSKTTRFKQG